MREPVKVNGANYKKTRYAANGLSQEVSGCFIDFVLTPHVRRLRRQTNGLRAFQLVSAIIHARDVGSHIAEDSTEPQ